MKKIFILLLSVCILSGCANTAPTETNLSATEKSVTEYNSPHTEENTSYTTDLNFGRDTVVTVECNLIDKSLDCEKIILERAETLHRMIYDYLSFDESTLVYSLGERCTKPGVFDTYKVISDEIKTYDDFKDMFSDEIYGSYIDYICSDTPRLLDIDGELYFHECLSGIIGIYETWYLGYEVTDYSIIGHFAALEGVPTVNEDHLNNKEYLNNEENYLFYDIIVHNINGNYVLTGCGTLKFNNHGMFYNSGKADRSLIYNEKVKPKTAVND